MVKVHGFRNIEIGAGFYKNNNIYDPKLAIFIKNIIIKLYLYIFKIINVINFVRWGVWLGRHIC